MFSHAHKLVRKQTKNMKNDERMKLEVGSGLSRAMEILFFVCV